MSDYATILLAIDLTDESYPIARKAQLIMQAFNAKLHIIHVIEPIPVYAMGHFDHHQIELEQKQAASEHIDELTKELGLSLEAKWVRQGMATMHILNVAKQIQPDLIILGSHGASGLARLLGSTTSTMIDKAQCDVLTIRCPQVA